VLLPLTYAIAFALPPLLVGGLGVARAMTTQPVPPRPLEQTLAAPSVDRSSKPIALIVAGNSGTESSDLLGPYEALATSGKFDVYVAAPERRLSPLFPGNVGLVPHFSFAEFDTTFGRAADLVVVPYIPNGETTDSAVLAFIARQARSGSTILSICGGAKNVADAGVLGGQTATSHHDVLPIVERTHPEVHWVRGLRYVDSGQFISSAGITSGVDATLYTLGRMYGRAVADATARQMGYPHTRFLDDPTWIVPTPSIAPLLPNAYRWDQTDVGVILYDGVREVELGSIIDTYPRSFAANVHSVAPRRTVIHSLHGLQLVPRDEATTAPKLDRVLVPGHAIDPARRADIDGWVRQRFGLAPEYIHAGDAYAYDATFRDMARQESNGIVHEAATGIEYPTRDLQLDGPALRIDLLLRPVALGLLGIGALMLMRRVAARPATS
jgi:putative intracellular protease/amidase